MPSIAVIDYGMGNLRSVSKALEKVAPNQTVVITSDPKEIQRADRVMLPGVGAIRDCMSEIHRLELADVIHEVAKTKPFLGVCLGMHALMAHSTENGGIDGLSLFKGDVKRFPEGHNDNGEKLKVPHMGWNQVWQKSRHPMWNRIEDGSRFYFVHSYYVTPSEDSDIQGETDYGYRFVSVIGHENVFATQFHPEKSHRDGLQLLTNFVQWDGTI